MFLQKGAVWMIGRRERISITPDVARLECLSCCHEGNWESQSGGLNNPRIRDGVHSPRANSPTCMVARVSHTRGLRTIVRLEHHASGKVPLGDEDLKGRSPR